jgi:hypothetical protein
MVGVGGILLAAATVIILAAMPRRATLRLQLIAVAAASIVLAGLSASRAADYDPGGNPAQTLAAVMAARQRGAAVEIRGICYSACALKLAAGSGTCVAPNSQIGVHEVRQSSTPWNYQGGVRNNLWTGFFEGMLPACARDLFAQRQGFASGRLIVASGVEILHACPAIHACAG